MKIRKISEQNKFDELNRHTYSLYLDNDSLSKLDLRVVKNNFDDLIGHIEYYEKNGYDVYVVENIRKQLSKEEISLLKNINKYNL
jgi:hypothetical protein